MSEFKFSVKEERAFLDDCIKSKPLLLKEHDLLVKRGMSSGEFWQLIHNILSGDITISVIREHWACLKIGSLFEEKKYHYGELNKHWDAIEDDLLSSYSRDTLKDIKKTFQEFETFYDELNKFANTKKPNYSRYFLSEGNQDLFIYPIKVLYKRILELYPNKRNYGAMNCLKRILNNLDPEQMHSSEAVEKALRRSFKKDAIAVKKPIKFSNMSRFKRKLHRYLCMKNTKPMSRTLSNVEFSCDLAERQTLLS